MSVTINRNQPTPRQKRTNMATLTKPFGRILTPIFPVRDDTIVSVSPPDPTTSSNRNGYQPEFVDDADSDASTVEPVGSQGLTVEASKLQSEKVAAFEIDHDWMLKDEMAKRGKMFERLKKQLTIALPDEDPLEGINNRIEEIHSMVKPKIELLDFLGNLNQAERERVLSMNQMNTITLRRDRRKNWKASDYLRYAFRMVFLASSVGNSSRRYFYTNDPEAGPSIMRKQRLLHRHRVHRDMKSSLSFELQNILMTEPQYRTDENIKKVLWLLKTTKAFQNLFPPEMNDELARVVAYERYDHNRHIAYQGRKPERFYFVISGKINKLREYKLPSGCLNKFMGAMQKGGMSDSEEFENNEIRQEHLVSSGPVELLTLCKQDYFRLLHTTPGLPVEFLLSIDLFREFPAEIFLLNASSITYKYYCGNKVICSDVTKTPWLHVVKSGQVKLVRSQYVYDTSRDSLFQEDKLEPGIGRTFSHAKAMLGNLDSQRRLRNPDISLSQLMRQRSKPKTNAVKETQIKEITEDGSELAETEQNKTELVNQKTDVKKPDGGLSLPAIVVNGPEFKPSRMMSAEIKLKGPWSRRSQLGTSEGERSLDVLPDIVNPGNTRTFLTRDKTTVSDIMPATGRQKGHRNDLPLRDTIIQLDLLKPGDVYGLEDIAQKFRYEQRDTDENWSPSGQPSLPPDDNTTTMSLVSDGAEVIKINKRLFLRHARNNTMLRVEIMQRSYLSPEETQEVLYTQDTWSQYKEAVMKKVISSLVR